MDKDQLVEHVAIPLLGKIPKGLTPESVLAVEMVIAHESKRGEFLRQKGCVGDVGAFGLIQMEKKTHDSTWEFGDSIYRNALKLGIITQYQFDRFEHPPVERLLYDLRYNVFMLRQRLFMKLGRLPSDPVGMSYYLKKHWNSAGGAADDLSYYKDWAIWK